MLRFDVAMLQPLHDVDFHVLFFYNIKAILRAGRDSQRHAVEAGKVIYFKM